MQQFFFEFLMVSFLTGFCVSSGAIIEGNSGICSWYGAEGEIPQGWPTASGEGFDRFEMAAAHKTLPFGTIIRVKNGVNGKTVDVRINDRGPFIAGRILDLSFESFGLLENRDVGLIHDCSFEIIDGKTGNAIVNNYLAKDANFLEEEGNSGICSWYGAEGEIPQGWPTASGQGFDRFEMAAAHKTLPFGTVIRVTNGANGKTIDVTINDRGPFIPGRILDLTYEAFGILDDRDIGLIRDCRFEILGKNSVNGLIKTSEVSKPKPKVKSSRSRTGGDSNSGICAWHGAEGEIPQGWPTASGEGFDRFEMAAAHKTLPFGTLIRVKNLGNEKTVDVRINDRGPFVPGRIIDLTYEAFGRLDYREIGLIDCSFEIIGQNSTKETKTNIISKVPSGNQGSEDYFDENSENLIKYT